MKKFFMIFAMALSLIALSSCKEKYSLVYNVTVDGDADEAVDVQFPNGNFAVDGKAAFVFNWGSPVDTLLLGAEAPAEELTLGAALESENEDVRNAAEVAENDFKATAANGTYYVHFNGYVLEPITRVKIQIDTVFTNRLLEETAE